MIEQLLALLAHEQPTFILLAGPNGAGKSTFRKIYLDPHGFPCFDPDKIAREKLGRDPKTAREALEISVEINDQVINQFPSKMSFGLETVFSDEKGYKLALLRKAREHGFRSGVIYIGLDEPELSIARVMDRVQNGGHDVADDKIRSRFPRSLENLKKAFAIADFTLLVDNSGESRHRVFGMNTKSEGLKLWDRVPRWFSNLKLLTAK